MSTMTEHDRGMHDVATDRGQRPVPPDASPDRYLQEIRHTRAAMDETLEELAERFDPDRLVDDAWRWSRERMPDPRVALRNARGFGEDALVAIKRHPVPASIMGLGLVWMLSEVASGRSIEGSDIAGAARSTADGVSRASREASRRARSAYESAAATAHHIGSELGTSGRGDADGSSSVARGLHDASRQGREAVHEAGERARAAAHVVSGRARSAARSTADAYDANPLLFGLLAVAGGVVAGLAAPNTRPEQRALGEAGERLRREARRTGQEAAGEAIGRAVDAADEAVDRGLSRVDERLDEIEDATSPADGGGARGSRSPEDAETTSTPDAASVRPAGSPGSPTRPWR